MPLPDFLTFFSRFSHEKPGEISHFLTTPIGGENEKISLTTRRDRCYAVNPWRATPTAATANRLTNSGRTPTMGITGTAIAAKHGVCRAAFSKAVKEIQEEFGIAPSRPMKSKKACETYRLTNGQTPTGATTRKEAWSVLAGPSTS